MMAGFAGASVTCRLPSRDGSWQAYAATVLTVIELPVLRAIWEHSFANSCKHALTLRAPLTDNAWS